MIDAAILGHFVVQRKEGRKWRQWAQYPHYANCLPREEYENRANACAARMAAQGEATRVIYRELAQ